MLGKRPARIITITKARAPGTEVWVSGRCFPDKRNRGVCFEEVHIESGEDGVGLDPGAWAPLLIRDLPVFAWIPDGLGTDGGTWEGALLKAAGLIDKLLVDSARLSSGQAEPREVLGAVRQLRERTAGRFPALRFLLAAQQGAARADARARSIPPASGPSSPPSRASACTEDRSSRRLSSFSGFG